jgi:hypothetical protein
METQSSNARYTQVPPADVEELRPWFRAVVARSRNTAIPAFRYITRVLQLGAPWYWSVAHTIEMLQIATASGIPFPLTFEESEESEESASVGSVHFSHTGEVSTQTMSTAGWLRLVDEAYDISEGAGSRCSGQDQWCGGNASPQSTYSSFGSVHPSVDTGCSAVRAKSTAKD